MSPDGLQFHIAEKYERKFCILEKLP